MQITELPTTSPLFGFIQHCIQQKIESISVAEDRLIIKWYEVHGDQTAVRSTSVIFTPDEFKSLANTELKLLAVQSVLNHYPVGVSS